MFKQLLKQSERVRKAANTYLLMLEISKDKEFIKLIIDLNTESQLYEEGINSLGEKLSEIGGDYSPITIQKKEQKGQPTDRITLKDTGKFYKSFRVYFSGGDLIIVANPYKGDTNLYEDWGKEIIGLTDENLDLVKTVAQKKLLEIINKKIKLAA